MYAHRSGSCQRATLVPRNSRSSSADASCPGTSTTQASGRSSQRSSGTATTAASRTAGWAISWFSSSTELIHSPPDLMTSLLRSVICIVPLGCTLATSPVRSQPSANFSGSSSRW